MGHEVIVYGRILGASWRPGEDYRRLQDRNRAVIESLPTEDEWPWLVQGMFALPAEMPEGMYRRQVIHFGASFKDDPRNRLIWEGWLGKLEAVLRRLYWFSAVVHLETEFEPDRRFEWLPTQDALDRMRQEDPEPVEEWTRTVQESPRSPSS